VTFFSKTGREVGFRDLGAGEMFGELAAIDGLPRSTHIVALRPSFIATLPGAVFGSALEREPALALYVMRRLARLVRLLSDRVVEFSTLGVRNRIHAELLRLARQGKVSGRQARVENPPTHAEMATLISTHREAVTRELRSLTQAGLIRRERGALVILDLDRLEVLVRDVADTLAAR
jgi:CRP/FNR family transcriptional regulator, cyclic AMP receptor protein